MLSYQKYAIYYIAVFSLPIDIVIWMVRYYYGKHPSNHQVGQWQRAMQWQDLELPQVFGDMNCQGLALVVFDLAHSIDDENSFVGINSNEYVKAKGGRRSL